MLKGEIEILTAVALNKCTYKQITNSRIALSSTYVFSTIDSLVQQGYLINNKATGYRLTPAGARAFLESLPKKEAMSKLAHDKLLYKHSTRARQAISIIETLANEYTEKLEGSQN